MAISNYTPSADRIVHNTAVDFKEGMSFGQPVHLMQYDKSLPVVVVSLYSGGKVYSIPSNADVCVRVGKPDGTKVYNPVLGCNTDRTICYFEVTQQMTSAYGTALAILEITVGGDIAGSSYVPLDIAKNPAQDDAIESSDEYQIMTEVIADAQAVLTNPPKIQNGTWWIWNSEKKAYADSRYSAGGGGGTSETEVFICTILGSASSGYSCDKTVDEINAAYLAGKLVYAKDDTRVMPLVAIVHPQAAQFCIALAGGSLVGYSVTGSGTVTAISQQTQLKNLVTTISESSTNSNYPSAKAVWDAIPHSFVVDIQIAELGVLDSAPTIDKTFDEIYAAYTNGDHVYALVHCQGMDTIAGITWISEASVTFGNCHPDSADTASYPYMVCVDIMNGDTAEGLFEGKQFLPKATSADNGKVLMVKNGHWDLGSVSGGSSAQKLIVTATVSGYDAYDEDVTVDKTFTEIKAAYDSGMDVYAKIYVGTAFNSIVPCISCDSETAVFSAVILENPDTPDDICRLCLHVSSGCSEAYVDFCYTLPPIVTSADNGKAFVVKNGRWSVENISGSEKAWTKIIDTDVTETTMSFQNDSLNGATEFHIRWSNLQNASTTDSGLKLTINGIELGAVGSAAIVGKSGTIRYGWTHAKFDGLFWNITLSAGASTPTNDAMGNLRSIFNLVENVGAAGSIKISAPTTQYAPVSGKLEVWAR